VINIPDYPGFEPEEYTYRVKRGGSRKAWLTNRPITKAIMEDLQFICDMTNYETPQEILDKRGGIKKWLTEVRVHKRGQGIIARLDIDNWTWENVN